ncbi:Oligoxyloglucan reducing end-specific cellobiohydrolase [Hyaloscypha variabilis F]|uniref:Vacuolar protein sorting/targeting protein 10 n=1 Tax=Hyaloscypha variabilis (strain UAMH 11265 / GT02V1 / F) TaxID=1149755 RepID=A0A2J6RSN5_HYAVF|nr:Oligoxyloglucan reducing end-specific cellobiohydrolase [Hyaloscypha variabilis F]
MLELAMHPFDKKRAYIITNTKSHYKTDDRGNTWEEFTVDNLVTLFREPLNFNGGDSDRIIFNAMDCTGIFCEETTMYTTDNFKKNTKFLRADTSGCHWAKSTELFDAGSSEHNADRILCVVKGRFSPWRKDYRLLISDDFFQNEQEFEPQLEPGRTVKGIVNMAVVTKYLIVAASAEGTDEMALYISDDTIKWHRAVFPHDHKLVEEAYTVLEGTKYSIQVDVMTGRPNQPMGVFFTSNSNGTYFQRNIEHTNRNTWGLVDFEKVYGVEGVLLVNIVENGDEVDKSGVAKKIVSRISFDDGRTFQSMKLKDEDLHFHSVTDLSNSGRVFSSPAPGIIMAVGNTGKYRKDYDEGNLYVSDDAGATWRKALDGPHKYEFGDQGSILVAVKDASGLIDEIKYSLDHGKKWHDVDIPDDHKVRPIQLTTTQDSTSLKFLLEAVDDQKPNSNGYIITLDFDDMHERQCTDDDLELWHARVDEDGKPTCVMGHTQSYSRRKADADCFMKEKNFKDPQVVTEACECTDLDFECDYNFVRSEDRKNCDLPPGVTMILPEGECKAFGPDDTFKGSSGWRKIPGNDCKRKDGVQKDDPIERKCAEAVGPPSSGNVEVTIKEHHGQRFISKAYLERTESSAGSDETILMRTDRGVFMSTDHGKSFEQILEDAKIEAIFPHPYFNDMVFFLTSSTTVYYSTDRGRNIRRVEAPLPPWTDPSYPLPIMGFHPKNKDWIIWTGAKGCEDAGGCHAEASVTTDRFDNWKTLQRYVGRCEFIRESENVYKEIPAEDQDTDKGRDKLIYCEVREKESNVREGNPLKLVSSDDFFTEPGKEHFTNVVEFATMSEFMIVATKDDDHQTMNFSATADGLNFAYAKFPYGFVVPHQMGYTVLDSSTHSVFILVLVNKDDGYEYGSIIKSNSNGTFYTMALENVDTDHLGYVDFEKMFGIEGVAMVNVVANAWSKNFDNEGKILKTMITHNDGAEWDYLPPPKADENGKKYCSGSLEDCALHIHGYTERRDKTHTYSSTSAVGVMLATGNVGKYLEQKKEGDTFITADGGITWKFAKKGAYMWEFGDQGSIIVIVKERGPTNEVFYTLDEGDTWISHKFADEEMRIIDITTVPSDNSRNFLLWSSDSNGGNLKTINLDFTGLTDVQCQLDEDNVEKGDYWLWTPKHPKLPDNCLFGHVAQYYRKRTDKKCYNGRMIPHLHDIAKNCSCTRQDYECDWNYERQKDGTCKLIKDMPPPDHSLFCKEDATRFEYYKPTGYRRIGGTTCSGGIEFDKSEALPCPGHGDEFNKKHGPSGWAIFFAVTIPIIVAAGAGYWVWKNWASKFGQIRLGEQSSFDGEAPYIKYPVLVISGVVAVAQALPLLLASLWRSTMNLIGQGRSRRFTTRDSFARGRGDYAIVDEDEGELLGDESDEEV